MTPNALSRFRILDLTRARAGPTCVKQFADFGADVIRIESPPHLGEGMLMAGGRLGFDMQNLHRNTRSITLDLKNTSAKEIFYKLLGDKIDKNQTISFDKTRIYRLADEKTMCLSKGGTILGEIWKEEDSASYWINNDIFNHY